MIDDTDKYEGYYKGWVNDYGDVVKLVYPNHEAPSLDADQRLISDAPLILQALIDEREEVERLRERVKDLEYEVENWKGELSVRMHPIDYDALVNGGE